MAVCAALLTIAAFLLLKPVLAPITFALFVIAVVWPVQRGLQRRLPRFVALVITLFVTLFVVVALASVIAWGFGQAGQWLASNSARFQVLYGRAVDSLAGHGVFIAGLWAEHFDVRWLIRLSQGVTARIQGLFSFGTVILIFVILGLLEVEVTRSKLLRHNGETGRRLVAAGASTAAKLQKYMLIRTVMSLLTGIVIWAFISLAGLDLAVQWGLIAFALNYIPFIGPLVATVFPTLFAVVQFEAWETPAAVFLCLNLIQFMSGSYFEPRLAGASLSISPFIVLLAVVFWSFLWGIPGAFIGVPVTIAMITLCDAFPTSRWIAALLSPSDGK